MHLHPVPLVVYVLEGALTVEMASHPTRVFNPGEAFAEAVDTLHNGLNRGSVPTKFLIVFTGKEKETPLVWAAGSSPVGLRTSVVLQTSRTIMGEPILFPLYRNQFTVLVLEIAPGGRVGRHQHPVPPFAYVLEGTVSLEIEGQTPKLFTVGQAWTDSTNMWHDALNKGTTPARILVVFAGSEGTPVTVRP
jgi:quercetin dioxygenase-like cupin family protein